MTVMLELFYSPICPNCPKAKKVIMEITDEYNEKIRVQEINILSSVGQEKAQKYSVKGVPTIILNGRTKIVGVPTLKQLRRKLQVYVGREST